MKRFRAKLKSLFEKLPKGVVVTLDDGKVAYMNPAAQRMLGRNAKTARGGLLCAELCAHLSTGGAEECMTDCPLRRPGSAEKSVLFDGSFHDVRTYQWHQKEIEFEPLEKRRPLKVRCSRMPDHWLDAAKRRKRLTILEISEEPGESGADGV
jgi:PAS domain S-box-containing protein